MLYLKEDVGSEELSKMGFNNEWFGWGKNSMEIYANRIINLKFVSQRGLELLYDLIEMGWVEKRKEPK